MTESPIAPAVVTQRNCELVAGMSERQFLDWCRAHPELVARIGKLRVVPVEDLVAHLRSARSACGEHERGDEVDRVLALVGRQRKVS